MARWLDKFRRGAADELSPIFPEGRRGSTPEPAPAPEAAPDDTGGKPRVMVLGSSHIFAIGQGITLESPLHWSFKNLGDFCPGSRIVLPAEGGWEDYHLRPDLAAWLEKELRADRVLLTISGSDWLNYCLSNRPEPFDFILPSRPDLPEIEGARLIPYAEIRRELRQMVRNIVLGVETIRAHTDLPIAYIQSPPPIEDNEHMRATAMFDQEAIAARGVTPPILRLKLYLLHSEIVRDACEAAGVELVPVPAGTQTSEGFMRPECVGHDVMHANAAYGRSVVADLEARYA